jgi:hypothetical protein
MLKGTHKRTLKRTLKNAEKRPEQNAEKTLRNGQKSRVRIHGGFTETAHKARK